jgi:transposase
MINEDGYVVREAKIECTESALERFLGGRPKESLNVVLEACGIWYCLYDYLIERCNVVKVANTNQTELNKKKGKKTDRNDAKRLAELLKGNVIEQAFVPPKWARDYRDKVRHRQSFVEIKTALENMISSKLRRENIKKPFSDIFTKKGIRWLRSLEDYQINNYLDLIFLADEMVKKAKNEFVGNSYENTYKHEIGLLKSIPGVADLSASVIMSEIVDVKRFDDARALCKFSGLVSRVTQSGEVERYGGLVKQSSARLRTALILSAHIAVRYDNKFKRFFQKLTKRGKSYNTAIAAVAHKMLYIIWFMLTNNEEFHDGGIQVGEVAVAPR